jgi:hypothetical protein
LSVPDQAKRFDYVTSDEDVNRCFRIIVPAGATIAQQQYRHMAAGLCLSALRSSVAIVRCRAMAAGDTGDVALIGAGHADH